MGRSRIRNRLAELAEGEWLLYMDCDAEVCSPTFISTYLSEAEGHDVVCGGTGNMAVCPSQEVVLRHKYEKVAERHLTLERRRETPYAQFTTFNFMIRREVLLAIRFDEGVQGYGHEDTLLGLEMQRRGIRIHHIENKLIHLGLEDAETFLRKTREATRHIMLMDDEMKRGTRLGRTYLQLKAWHLVGMVALLFRLLQPLILCNLRSKHPSLMLLNVYKVGVMAISAER